MTFHSPTETNPPWTSPPTWPFPTSAADWEPDYRLRLLEAALVYLWTNQVGGLPTGPAGGALAGTYPNPTLAPTTTAPPSGPAGGVLTGTYPNPTLAPGTQALPNGPAGGDLGAFYPNPTVTMNIPAPLTPVAPFTTFTDSVGHIWIAKGGVNGGAYKDPRDVLHAGYYRNTAFTTPTSTANFIYDTVITDPYGIYSPTTGALTPPISGLYQITAVVAAIASAAQYVSINFGPATGFNLAGINTVGGAGYACPMIAGPYYLTAGTPYYVKSAANAALTGGYGQYNTWFNADYIGTR